MKYGIVLLALEMIQGCGLQVAFFESDLPARVGRPEDAAAYAGCQGCGIAGGPGLVSQDFRLLESEEVLWLDPGLSR